MVSNEVHKIIIFVAKKESKNDQLIKISHNFIFRNLFLLVDQYFIFGEKADILRDKKMDN